jgi:DNA-binding beta-propeller fold protein YncE
MSKQIYKIVLIAISLSFLFLLASCCKVSTVAGTGVPGSTDGPPATAQFNNPSGLVTDPWQHIYVADYENNKIRQIAHGTYTVSPFAGTGTAGCIDGHMLKQAQFYHPVDIARDATGNFYIADQGNQVIRKINIGTGMVTTIAGQCNKQFPRPYGCNDWIAVPESVPADSALFSSPSGIAVDPEGNVYVADFGTCSVRKINAASGLVTLVGKKASASVGCCGCQGLFSNPTGIDLDAKGNIYVAEYWGACQIKKIDPSGTVTVWAGTVQGYRDGPGTTEARFMHPYHIVVDKTTGNIYVADLGNNRIRKIANDAAHTVCTVAGNGVSGFSDDSWIGGCCKHNSGGDAEFNHPRGIEFVEELLLYVGDTENHRIRKIDP